MAKKQQQTMASKAKTGAAMPVRRRQPKVEKPKMDPLSMPQDDQHATDDVDISQEDLDFFQEHAEYLPVLAGAAAAVTGTTPRPTKPVPLPQPTHPVKKRCAEESDAESEVSGSDAEASYERDIRMFDKKTIRKDAASSDKLPIKTGIHGGWKMDDSAAAVSDHEAETENDDSDSDDFTFDAEEVRAPKPAPAPRKSDAEAKPTDFAGKKRAIALLATAIVAEPEESLGKLKELRAYGKDKDARVAKLAMLTQLSVFADIIPGYRIRELTDKERTMKVSKDVKKMRKYEESILQNYQGFLQQLATIVQENVPTSGSSSKASANPRFGLLHVAMRCFCELMQKCSHFNFRVNIMSAVVSRMNLRLPEGYAEAAGMEPDCIARMCCSTIESMFREDEHGENSLDTVKLIAKLVKARDYNVQPMVLDTFLALRLVESSSSMNAGARGGDEGDNPKQRKADKQHVSKRQKKKVKVDVEIEQELKEAEAVVDKEEQQKLFTETLKQVFVTYFRILKHAPESILLRSVLGGITRYGHLISVDYFDDLLAVIRHILANNFDDLSLTEALYCVVTVLTLFSGQGERLMAMDLNYFYAFAYRLLMEAPARLHDGRDARNDLDEADEEHEAQASFDDEESTVRLITKCMQLIFFKRGKNDLSATRAAAFIKRLLILTTVMESPASILALLECVRTLVARAPSKVHQILDTEENRVGDAGAYAPELDDPEMCHPFAAGTWELAILAQHWHPAVRQWVQDCCRGLFKQLLENQGNSTAAANAIVRAASPKQILSQYAIRGGCAFNPSLATLKRKPKKKVEGSKQLEPLCRRAMPLVSGEPMEVQKTECADISEKDLMSALRQLREVQELDQKRSSLRLLRRQSSFMRGYFKA